MNLYRNLTQPLLRPKFLESTGLLLIGFFSLLYDHFSRNFAEWHIQIPFLNFPIFVGEILLAMCLGIALCKLGLERTNAGSWRYILGFIAFILIKAIHGYTKWGPLALRDSALFYYFLFFPLSGFFYRRDFFSGNMLILVLTVLLSGLIGRWSSLYSILTWAVLALILLKTCTNKYLRMIGYLILFVGFPYKSIFDNARMIMVGHICAFMYFLIALFSLVSPRNRILSSFLLLSIVVTGFYIFPAKDRIASIANPKTTWELYKIRRQIVLEEKHKFRMAPIPHLVLYNPESKSFPRQTWADGEQLRPEITTDRYGIGNATFRAFIWHDMFDLLDAEKPIFGFDFGKPFRSISLEILKLGAGEWGRDGWIAPHNSYLNMIFHAGIPGLLFVLGIFFVWWKMAYSFIKLNSISGILLSAALLTWLIAANFGLVFELPYTAIPIWSLYGMTFRYWLEKKRYQNEKINIAAASYHF